MTKRLSLKNRDQALPAIARQQLTHLNGVLQEIGRNYLVRLQREIQAISNRVEPLEKNGEITRKQLRDLKEMLDLLEQLQLKPEKGRRKDLKKIDALIGELQTLVENW